MIVLDASAVVDMLLDQPASGWVLDQVEPAAVYAPAHQPAEVLSALGRLVRAGTIEDAVAREALEEAAGLPQELVLLSGALLRRAYRHRDRIRVLDGLYVALAVELDCPLVTTDGRLEGADAPCQLRLPPGA